MLPTCHTATGKVLFAPGKRVKLPGRNHDVIEKWHENGATRYPFTQIRVS